MLGPESTNIPHGRAARQNLYISLPFSIVRDISWYEEEFGFEFT